ncbi:hypothetical protein ASPZODRAFT_14851 [Penicilliopsis zonata CBS 506.65]|uniref:Cyanovirin-N domain-containing protein n=1 Tax=Penicilliopsis zonata CBS 506.65 TaxID=1073090 RepID=A0A1L9SNC3_9EURO|nr:hypothetical protein ASPZODRAFT_14851 [Penicilliopsis zonata CBS 506.65]OJJ48725.1 hypothetical protein ASPZODRAFT_14851 [Penicilliopsis zonata CBS 506.65]
MAPRYHFHESAKEIRLDGWTLRAKLRRNNGDWVDVSLPLGDCLGNKNGTFQWGGQYVDQSAQNPTLVYWEGYPILRASLKDNNGIFHERDFNLSDKIGNGNGKFIVDFAAMSFSSYYYSSATNSSDGTTTTGHRYSTASHTDPEGNTVVRTAHQDLGQPAVVEERRYDRTGQMVLPAVSGDATKRITELDESGTEASLHDPGTKY